MKKTLFALTLLAGLGTIAGCKKDGDPVATVDNVLNSTVIKNISGNVASAEYTALAAKTTTLNNQVLALDENRTNENLTACRQTWREARQIWEQSEALLFGPVETDNIDPRIDTWPVDYVALNSQLDSENAFTEEYINNLEDALKGFHPIEYLLFGVDGDKSAANLTDREMEYLKALTLNVQVLTANLEQNWISTSSTNYYFTFFQSGHGSQFPTERASLEQLVSAMTDICNEVANTKMKDPYDAQDPSLEESPFAKSSMTDFINNITGIQNVYLGKFQVDGPGLEDIVKKYNLSLDSDIKAKLASALAAMNNVTHPFGTAIVDQHTQIESAMAAINDLKTTLEEDLLPFVTLHSN